MSDPRFRRGVPDEKRSSKTPNVSEMERLSDMEKERLCVQLLHELGAGDVREANDRGELIHGCLLPFGNHQDQDRNPTASLNYRKLVYNCFGCGSGGSLLWFVGVVRDQSAAAARDWLVQKVGLGTSEESVASLLSYFDALYNPEKKVEPPIPRMDPKVLDPWLFLHPYMTEIRGIPEDTLMRFKVGYGHLRVRGSAGLSESERIVIPHFWKGDLVGWQSRRLYKDGTPKYLSSPDFPKDRTIFNHDPKAKKVVIVESPMSVLSKAHLDVHIEATFGAQVTARQMRLISAHPRIVLFMDNDGAGWRSTEKLAEYLEPYSPVLVANNPYAADPADLDDETYLRAVEDAIPYPLWSPPTELLPWDPEKERADASA